MTQAKHTPGPWRLIDPGKSYPHPAVSRGIQGGFVVLGLDPETELADARLIAAAPEMLAALEIADKFCGSMTSDDCPDSVHIPIRVAIAKATVETP